MQRNTAQLWPVFQLPQGNNHKSKECESLKTCRHCKRKHHQSICDKANVSDSNLTNGKVSKNTYSNDGTPTSTNTTNMSKNRHVILL